MININIIDKVCEEKYWEMEPIKSHLSGHTYRNSPYESDDTCANCNSAMCDVCKTIYEYPHLECSIQSDELYKILLDKQVPKEIASELTYGETSTYKNYHLIWPTEDILKRYNNDAYIKLSSQDEEIVKIIELSKYGSECYGDIKRKVLTRFNINTESVEYMHINKQLEMYWAKHEHELKEYFK